MSVHTKVALRLYFQVSDVYAFQRYKEAACVPIRKKGNEPLNTTWDSEIIIPIVQKR